MAIMLRAAVYLMLLLLVAKCTTSARVLDKQPAAQQTSDTVSPAAAKAPAEAATPPVASMSPPAEAMTPPVASMSPAEAMAPPSTTPQPSDPASTANTGAEAMTPPDATSQPSSSPISPSAPLIFFMHDILGGSRPSACIVTDLVATTDVINTNNVPCVPGLGGTTATVVQNNGNSANGGSNALPLVNAADLPTGTTPQNLLFGTTMVIDDELTEGHEIGSSVIGRAEGFYVASSQDGASHTLLLTAMFEGGEYADTLSFFGVHHSAAPESHIAIIGGTGKYENAKGYAAIETLHPTDQHMTDGVETLLQFSVFLS
ncbi:dirigent protein 9-like [Typha latifolia]|uniref:dirigent protein 9-like n=1 Tax=Typha latifolia TaxID=4733 RepID=UPI003C305704